MDEKVLVSASAVGVDELAPSLHLSAREGRRARALSFGWIYSVPGASLSFGLVYGIRRGSWHGYAWGYRKQSSAFKLEPIPVGRVDRSCLQRRRGQGGRAVPSAAELGLGEITWPLALRRSR